MALKYRWPLVRQSIIEETFWVEAETQAQAIELAHNGEYSDRAVTTEWIDWLDDSFQPCPVTEPQIVDPLVEMVKNYQPQPAPDNPQ